MSRYVPIQAFSALQRGTIIRGKSTQKVYVVTANYGDRVTAVATADITHLDEWEMFEMSSAQETAVVTEEGCAHCQGIGKLGTPASSCPFCGGEGVRRRDALNR